MSSEDSDKSDKSDKKRRSMFQRRKKTPADVESLGNTTDGSVIAAITGSAVLGKKESKDRRKSRKKGSSSMKVTNSRQEEHKAFIRQKMGSSEDGMKLKKLDSMGLIPHDVLRHRVPTCPPAVENADEGSATPDFKRLTMGDFSAVPLTKPTEVKDAVPVEVLLEKYADLAQIGSDVFRSELLRNACDTEEGVPHLRGLLRQQRELRRVRDHNTHSAIFDDLVRFTKGGFSNDPLINDKKANKWHRDSTKFTVDERMKVLMKHSYKLTNSVDHDFNAITFVLVCGLRSREEQALWCEAEARISEKAVRNAYQGRFRKEITAMVREVCNIALKANLNFRRATNAVVAQKLLCLEEGDWPQTCLQDIQALWQDPSLVGVLSSFSDEKQEKYRVLINAAPRVLDKKYSPTLEDTYFITGLVNSVREVRYYPKEKNQNSYKFVGISRLRWEQHHKWIHQYDHFDHIMFFADVSSLERAKLSAGMIESLKGMSAHKRSNFMIFFGGESQLRAELAGGADVLEYFPSCAAKDPIGYIRETILTFPRDYAGQMCFYDLPLPKGKLFVDVLEEGMQASRMEVVDIGI